MTILMPQSDLWDESYGFMKNPFSPNLRTFSIGAIWLGGQLLSTVDYNMSRTNENFIPCTYNIHDGEHTMTFVLSICCSSRILQQYGVNNFVLFTISLDLGFLTKLTISQTEHFWENFTKVKLYGFMSR